MRQTPPPGVEELLDRARKGDAAAREILIAEHRHFVLQVAAAYCRRPLDWSCDEFSVALVAFNEAIDAFQPRLGVPFPAFARLVIKSRLADFLRRERRRARETPAGACVNQEWSAGAVGCPLPSADAVREAWAAHVEELAAWERREELHAYRTMLARYHLDFRDLVRATPRHRDTRRTLVAAARSLARRPDLMAYLERTGRLPLQELELATGLSRKVLERGRKYVLALSLIFAHPEEFPFLNDHLRGAGEGKPSGQGTGN